MFDALQIIRIPGPHGPTLRLSGHLVRGTADQLRAAVSELAPARHRALVLDLSRLEDLDSAGVAGLMHAEEACRRERVRLLLVNGKGRTARLLTRLGLDQWMLTAQTAGDAQEVLEFMFGGSSPAAPRKNDSLRRSIAEWRGIERDLQRVSPEETTRRVTSCTRCATTARKSAGWTHRTPSVGASSAPCSKRAAGAKRIRAAPGPSNRSSPPSLAGTGRRREKGSAR